MPVRTKARRKASHSKPRRDVYAEVTNTIVAQLEAGAGSWRKPWQAIASGPRNVSSRKLYRGINAFLLAVEALEKGYDSPTWGTFNQWHRAEEFLAPAYDYIDKNDQLVEVPEQLALRTTRTVRRGEKASTAILWKPFEKSEENDDGKTVKTKRLLVRAFAVFNAAQVDVITYDADGVPTAKPLDLEEQKPVHTDERVDEAEEFIAHTGAEISFGGDRAYYTPGADRIQLPVFKSFESANDYYSTAAHELTHWTGHEKRLNRDHSGRFGDDQYAMEELTAELGSAFVCAHLGLESEPRKDHSAYLASWIRTLKADSKAIFTVAAAAQRACDFLVGASASAEDTDETTEVAV